MFRLCIFPGFPEYMLESQSVKSETWQTVSVCQEVRFPDQEIPLESRRLGITLYAFSTQTQTSAKTSTLNCGSYTF